MEEEEETPTDSKQAVKSVQDLITKQVRPLEDKLALQDLFFKNPDAKEYATDMVGVVKDNPGISWDAAYKLAKFDRLENKVRQEATQEAYKAIKDKESFSTATPTQRVQEQKNVLDIIKDRSVPLSEVRKILLEQGLGK